MVKAKKSKCRKSSAHKQDIKTSNCDKTRVQMQDIQNASKSKRPATENDLVYIETVKSNPLWNYKLKIYNRQK